jgi:hypothetical protein
MKICTFLLAVAILMLAFVGNLFSQGGASPIAPEELGTKFYLGPVVGYNSVSHSTKKLATFAGDAYCPFFEGGTGQGFFGGLTYEYPLGKKIEESTSSIIGRVIFSMYPGSMKQQGDKFPSLVEDELAPELYRIVNTETEHSLDISYSVVALEVMYKQNISKSIPLGVTAGPTFEIPIQKDIEQLYKLIRITNNKGDEINENVSFARVYNNDGSLKYEYRDNDRTVVVKDGEIENAAGIRIGLKFGLQYEVIIGEGYFIVPAVYYNWSLMNVKSDENYRINLWQVAVDVRFAL